jgi:serine/threonine-protein kinase ATR
MASWIRYRKAFLVKQFSSTSRRSARIGQAPEWKSDNKLVTLSQFVDSIPLDTIADAAFDCGAYTRSLQYYETYLRKIKMNDCDLQGRYSKLQLIYSHLDEPDAVVGVSSKILMPTLEQQILEHESLGKWDMALDCYELAYQKDSAAGVSIGMLDCMKNLGHLGNAFQDQRRHIVTNQMKEIS